MKIQIRHENTSFEKALNHFKSPEQETSIVKGVPIQVLEQVKKLLKESFPEGKLSIRYRGPRKEQDGRHCIKQNAVTAAIYFHADSYEYKIMNGYCKRVLKF